MISVIVPVYNRASKIKRAIESVLCQTYKDFELIIVNDCSTDKTVQTINQFTDSRIKLLHTPKNSGAAVARNIGIKNAKGDIISFLDSDDFYEPEILEVSYNLLNESNSKTGFIWTGLRYISNNKNSEFIWEPAYKENAYITFLNSLHIGIGCGISIKKIVFEKSGAFNESLSAAEDTEFFLRITRDFEFKFSNEILINIDKTGIDRLSKDYKKNAIAYNNFMPNHFNDIDKKPSLQKKYYYKLMWLNYHLEEKSTGDRYFKMLKKINLVDKKIFFVHLLFKSFPLKMAIKLHLYLSK
jgi:glycosyltransferase involved in cell wall biosynthesis